MLKRKSDAEFILMNVMFLLAVVSIFLLFVDFEAKIFVCLGVGLCGLIVSAVYSWIKCIKIKIL